MLLLLASSQCCTCASYTKYIIRIYSAISTCMHVYVVRKYSEQSYMEMGLSTHFTCTFHKLLQQDQFQCFNVSLLLPLFPFHLNRHHHVYWKYFPTPLLSVCLYGLYFSCINVLSVCVCESGKNWIFSWIGIFVIRFNMTIRTVHFHCFIRYRIVCRDWFLCRITVCFSRHTVTHSFVRSH